MSVLSMVHSVCLLWTHFFLENIQFKVNCPKLAPQNTVWTTKVTVDKIPVRVNVRFGYFRCTGVNGGVDVFFQMKKIWRAEFACYKFDPKNDCLKIGEIYNRPIKPPLLIPTMKPLSPFLPHSSYRLRIRPQDDIPLPDYTPSIIVVIGNGCRLLSAGDTPLLYPTITIYCT